MSIQSPLNPRQVLLVLFLFFSFGLVSAIAEPSTRILEVEGPGLRSHRPGESHWFRSLAAHEAKAQERLQTDDKTSSTLNFHSGGNIVIGPNSLMKVGSQGVEQPSLEMTKGVLWGDFSESAQPFRLKTPRGVMNVEESEFIVTVNESTGATDLKVIDGSVTLPDDTRVPRGRSAQFDRQAWRLATYAATGSEVYAAREAALLLFDEDTRYVIRPVITRASWYLPGRYRWGGSRWNRYYYYYNSSYYYARRALRVLTNPNQTLTNEVAHQVNRHVGFGLGSAIRRASRPPRPVARLKMRGVTPLISWKKCKGASKYAVVISKDKEGQDVLWHTIAQGTQAQYPSYGPDLAKEKYHLFVMPLQKNGKPHTYRGRNLGKRGSFRGKGHVAQRLPIYGLRADATSGPPKLAWQPFRQAKRYKIRVLRGEEVIATDSSDTPDYQYPMAARSLQPGDYSTVVEAYDASGFLMGKAEAVNFSTTGWEAKGLASR